MISWKKCTSTIKKFLLPTWKVAEVGRSEKVCDEIAVDFVCDLGKDLEFLVGV